MLGYNTKLDENGEPFIKEKYHLKKQHTGEKSSRFFLRSKKKIANLLTNEATHSFLGLFEKQPLLITFENAFDQKIGPVYSPNGPMLEFEINGDRSIFLDLLKMFLEIRCKVMQANGADLRYDNIDPTVSD